MFARLIAKLKSMWGALFEEEEENPPPCPFLDEECLYEAVEQCVQKLLTKPNL
jgi:hypothetical protein